MKKPTDFSEILSRFLTSELPVSRNVSTNTIISYRDAYILLLVYADELMGIKPEKLKIKDITVEAIMDFLNWLEQVRNNSISTRNQRLAAVHALFRYIQSQAPEYMFQSQQIMAIPFKKNAKKLIGYLSVEQTRDLLSAPDVTCKKGRRNQAMLCLLYDSGSRVQELADLKVMNLRLDAPAQVMITGKGRKTRNVPLMDKTVNIMNAYLLENGLTKPDKVDTPLFFNSRGKKLTRQGIAYILNKYVEFCNLEDVSPHKIRHTKAMHLTEADVNPIFIRDFLGHTDLKVTEIYSKTSIKMKKQALEKLSQEQMPLPDTETKDWNKDKDLMDWLSSLGH